MNSWLITRETAQSLADMTKNHEGKCGCSNCCALAEYLIDAHSLIDTQGQVVPQ